MHDLFNHPSFQKDSSYNYVIHIHNCNVTYNHPVYCRDAGNANNFTNNICLPLLIVLNSNCFLWSGLPSVYSPSETSSNPNNDFLPVPKGIFYTQESDKPNHSGYLRIIPLAYENTVTSCEDYRDLVRVRRWMDCWWIGDEWR